MEYEVLSEKKCLKQNHKELIYFLFEYLEFFKIGDKFYLDKWTTEKADLMDLLAKNITYDLYKRTFNFN